MCLNQQVLLGIQHQAEQENSIFKVFSGMRYKKTSFRRNLTQFLNRVFSEYQNCSHTKDSIFLRSRQSSRQMILSPRPFRQIAKGRWCKFSMNFRTRCAKLLTYRSLYGLVILRESIHMLRKMLAYQLVEWSKSKLSQHPVSKSNFFITYSD